ncbi:hypothetical protein DFP72DRAFT_1051256 [Ephemerocybe angulata]|uniref:Uncharacterized protein n=1 Tax=Ephemerocybe angulata TaxID=980116 RepID=A0A8H6LVP1_9AGAR|nr:hypothetical protein DFP72DRAFT_1051256 [Tulosesus angulatus]
MSEQSSTQSYSEEGNILPPQGVRLASVVVLVERGLPIARSLVCVAVEIGLFPLDAFPGHVLAADASSSESLSQSYGDAFSDDSAGDEVSGESDDENDIDHHRDKRQRLSTGNVSPANSDVFSLEDIEIIGQQFPRNYALWAGNASEGDDSDDELGELDASPKYTLTSNVIWSAGAGCTSDTESGSDSDEEVEDGPTDYTLRTLVNWAALKEGSDDEYDQLVDEDEDEESAAYLAEPEDNEDDTEDASEPIAALDAVCRELPLNHEDDDEESAAYLAQPEDNEDDNEDAREPIAALYAVLRELPVNRFGTTQLVVEDEDEETAAYLAEPEDNEEDTEDASEPTGIAALYAVLRELPLNRWGTIC